MPWNPDKDIASLCTSPDRLRKLLRDIACEYLDHKTRHDEALKNLHMHKQASAVFSENDSHVIDDRDVVADMSLKMIYSGFDLQDTVRCLAKHKKDGWYAVIGQDVVKAINDAFIAHNNSPQDALRNLAPMLSKLEPPKVTPQAPKGPLL